MKRIISFFILLIMVTLNTSYGENTPVYTLRELFEMYINPAQIDILFNKQPDFKNSFTDIMDTTVLIESSSINDVQFCEATVFCHYVDSNKCNRISISFNISNERTDAAALIIEEIKDNFGLYKFQRKEYNIYFRDYVYEDVSEAPIIDILSNQGQYILTLRNGATVKIICGPNDTYFDIEHNQDVSIKPVGAGFYIGDTYQYIVSSPHISIIKKDDSLLTFTSEFLTYPSYFLFKFNEKQELTHGTILISGSYSLDTESFDTINRELSSVYEMVQEYKTDKEKKSIFVTNEERTYVDLETQILYLRTDSNNIDGTICIHEIKEEEGTVYHTLTFMPEEEYNQTLFQNYLNN